jgi:hypothetical protein
MQKTTRRTPIRQFLATMLLGLVMAVLIAVLAEPELAWLGFALAAIHREAGGRGSCASRLRAARR